MDDVIYITGNQETLGDWNPEKIKMDRISDFQRELILNLKSPAQFKFTRGTWETEDGIKETYKHVTIKPESQSDFEFEIQNYFDKEE